MDGERAEDSSGTGRLDDRVLVALQELHGQIAFSGLRRVLGAHPESLSRALHRLEREGLVERTHGGYRALAHEPGVDTAALARLRPIAHVRIPPGASPDSVLGRLSGRWFGTLRWVGVIDRPSQRLFAWARRDGSGYVLLGIHGGSLRVYVPDDPGSGDLAEAEDAAYELLGHAVGALRPPAPNDGIDYLRARPAPATAPLTDN
jgi:hypothetical protein